MNGQSDAQTIPAVALAGHRCQLGVQNVARLLNVIVSPLKFVASYAKYCLVERSVEHVVWNVTNIVTHFVPQAYRGYDNTVKSTVHLKACKIAGELSIAYAQSAGLYDTHTVVNSPQYAVQTRRK